MATAVGISGGIAYFIGTDPQLLTSLFFNEFTGRINAFAYIVMFGPVGMSFLYGRVARSASYQVLVGFFLLFAVMMGLSLSFIFMIYTQASIAQVFVGATALYTVMAVLGYTTKTDLTKFGTILMIAFGVLFTVSLINFFIGSSMISYITSAVGVIIFTGLTAYQMQQIKEVSHEVTVGTESAAKLSLVSAMGMYITFINLFMSLLRLFGDRR
jgi:FtsH-binding integral membrane protein